MRRFFDFGEQWRGRKIRGTSVPKIPLQIAVLASSPVANKFIFDERCLLNLSTSQLREMTATLIALVERSRGDSVGHRKPIMGSATRKSLGLAVSFCIVNARSVCPVELLGEYSVLRPLSRLQWSDQRTDGRSDRRLKFFQAERLSISFSSLRKLISPFLLIVLFVRNTKLDQLCS